MPRPTVLLYDIDGTLITTGGVGRRALELAFLELHGREDAFTSFRLDGMTDRLIARLAFKALGLEPTEPRIDALLANYLRHLEALVAKADPAEYRPHPGMREAVLASRAAGHAVGLGTGNLREGARLKLAPLGLFEHFDFGGYGDDHEDRATLIRIGAERGAAHLKVSLAEARVVIIGDTPKDVAAAQAMGAQSVGVGTAAFTAQQLREAGATWAFDSLASPGALDAVLHGHS
jgi:phosphoglycolate phosphatase-like HAD superfamily hydrolase